MVRFAGAAGVLVNAAATPADAAAASIPILRSALRTALARASALALPDVQLSDPSRETWELSRGLAEGLAEGLADGPVLGERESLCARPRPRARPRARPRPRGDRLPSDPEGDCESDRLREAVMTGVQSVPPGERDRPNAVRPLLRPRPRAGLRAAREDLSPPSLSELCP